jgi:protein CpxP
MRKFHISAGFLSFVIALAISLPALGQASAPSSSPQSDPAAAPPAQSEPATSAPAASEPAQAQPPQSEPAQSQSPQAQPSQPEQSQPASPSQSNSGASAGQGQAHPQSGSSEDNPLNLTDEQKAKLRPIVADENQQLDAVRNDSSMSAEQKVQKANQIREVATPKIKAILTQEQLQKLAEMQQKARQQQGAPSSDSQKPQQ